LVDTWTSTKKARVQREEKVATVDWGAKSAVRSRTMTAGAELAGGGEGATGWSCFVPG
jgi:hypothetical protein